MTLPKRRAKVRMNVHPSEMVRSDGHLKWIRGHICCLDSDNCDGKIQAAHVRFGNDGGVGMKPGDNFTLPLCAEHHAAQHRIGEPSFWQQAKMDPHAIAKALWDQSPHRHKWEQKMKESGG